MAQDCIDTTTSANNDMWIFSGNTMDLRSAFLPARVYFVQGTNAGYGSSVTSVIQNMLMLLLLLLLSQCNADKERASRHTNPRGASCLKWDLPCILSTLLSAKQTGMWFVFCGSLAMHLMFIVLMFVLTHV